MEPLSARLNYADDAPEIPEQLVEMAHQTARNVTNPDHARDVFNELAPALSKYKANPEFALACGLLVEKQRRSEGMLDFWEDLAGVFPGDMTPLRMMMRWYRRQRQTDEGINRLHGYFPKSRADAGEAEKALIGFAELKAYDEIDRMMAAVLPVSPAARSLRMRYIKVLAEQSRYLEAQQVAQEVKQPQKMGVSSQALLATVERRAAKMAQLFEDAQGGVFQSLFDKVAPTGDGSIQTFGSIAFITGQLGPGGAERQMTRLSSAFQASYQSGETIGGRALTAPVEVVVKHAKPAAGADFYIPELKRARVQVTDLSKTDAVPLTSLRDLDPEIVNQLELLPEDVFEHTCKLIAWFRERQTQVAYIWQDGAVLAAGVAAVLAGVPRVVTSFRGLPPNLRPSLNRPEMKPLYLALAKRAGVTYSANSQSTATAYENWLGFEAGTIVVIPNASPAILPDGDHANREMWEQVEQKSPRCSKTVMGVFRFDENKRPDVWIEAAAQYAIKNPDTRFVVAGTGYQWAPCEKRVRELGLTRQIFLVGLQKNVGFWLHKADLLLHLAKMEGLPNALIEAHLAGVPVLATPAGGTAEVVVDGKTGRLFDSAETLTVREIFEGLTELLSDGAALKTMGREAYETVSPRFLLENVVDRTAALFANMNGDA